MCLEVVYVYSYTHAVDFLDRVIGLINKQCFSSYFSLKMGDVENQSVFYVKHFLE